MKVPYKTTIRKEGHPPTEYYVCRKRNGCDAIFFCCVAMEDAWVQGAIVFGGFDCGHTNSINIGLCHPYPEGASWDNFEISFCPFCGEAIECVEAERSVLVKKVTTTVKEVKSAEWVEETMP